MIYKKYAMRPAFSMLTAIVVIVLMASVAIFILNISGKLVKETSAQYQKEQAILLAKSYTEYAIMAATPRDCIKKITAFVGDSVADVNAGNGFDVLVDIQYVGNELSLTGAASCTQFIGGDITTPESEGSVMLIDTYVRYRDTDTVSTFLTGGGAITATNLPWLTYHRRTLQRL